MSRLQRKFFGQYYLLRKTFSALSHQDATRWSKSQETFIDAWRDIRHLSTERSFVQWLYVIARYNRLAAERRRRLRRFVTLEWRAGGRSLAALGQLDEVIGEVDVQQRVLNTLAPTQREVLVLYAIGGFVTRDIAAMLGISLDAARQRLTRAKREFAREYRRLHEE